MNSSGELGAMKQLWLNKGGVATIILLKQIKLIWPVSYNSGNNGGLFVIHSNQGDIVVCNNKKLKWLLALMRMLPKTSSE